MKQSFDKQWMFELIIRVSEVQGPPPPPQGDDGGLDLDAIEARAREVVRKMFPNNQPVLN
jgi:hypothetical protein